VRQNSYKTAKEAEAEGKRLAKELGPKWTFKFHENIGWYYSACSPCGRLSVHFWSGKYCAMLSDLPGAGSPGWYSDARYKTPKAAVLATIQVAKRTLDKRAAMVYAAAAMMEK